jgi:hypothetical protein
MKLKNVKIGETYIIKSLDHTVVGNAPFEIGDEVEVVRLYPDYRAHSIEVKGGWFITHKDLKRVDITYTHPMQEHLGKEVEVLECSVMMFGQGNVGMRGFVVGLQGDNLIVDFGDGFNGHNAIGVYHKPTCNFMQVEDLRFLTEDKE